MNQNLDQALTATQRLSRFTVRVGGAMARWAATQGWGKLLVLAVLALIAQSILTDKLLHWDERPRHTTVHTHAHPAVKHTDGTDEDVQIGWNGIRVTSRPHSPAGPAAAAGAASGTGAVPGTGAAAGAGTTPGSATAPAATGTPAAGATAPAGATLPSPPSSPSSPATAPTPAAASGDSTTGAGTTTAKPEAAAVASDGRKPAAADADSSDEDDDDEDVVVSTSRTNTLARWARDAVQGMLMLVIVYLIAAKIVLRQTAKSDARAKQAEASAAAASADAEHETLKRQLAEAQLQALQAQVEPHFLFNTLASVDYLIETDPARASAMQKNLIQYLRAALPQMRTQASQLGREADLSRAYLGILKMRMEDRLQVVVDVPDGLRSAEFPPMMLQTLVENAIQHGVEPKPEGGEVRVSAHVVDGELEVVVADTGVGLAAGTASSTAGGGVGLANVRERLDRLYGGHASFSLVAREPTGAVASVRVPYRVASAGRAGATGAATAGSTRRDPADGPSGAAGAPA